MSSNSKRQHSSENETVRTRRPSGLGVGTRPPQPAKEHCENCTRRDKSGEVTCLEIAPAPPLFEHEEEIGDHTLVEIPVFLDIEW
jgi:hypothetical protein